MTTVLHSAVASPNNALVQLTDSDLVSSVQGIWEDDHLHIDSVDKMTAACLIAGPSREGATEKRACIKSSVRASSWRGG